MQILPTTESDLPTIVRVNDLAFPVEDVSALAKALLEDPTALPLVSLLAVEADEPIGYVLHCVKGTMLTFGHLDKYEGGLVGGQAVRMGRLEALRERAVLYACASGRIGSFVGVLRDILNVGVAVLVPQCLPEAS